MDFIDIYKGEKLEEMHPSPAVFKMRGIGPSVCFNARADIRDFLYK